MALETSALIAEIVSGIAVVVTLIYLVFELRRNTAATQSSAQYAQMGFGVWNEGFPMPFATQFACVKAWDSMKDIYDEEFRSYVQSTIDELSIPDAATPIAWAKPLPSNEA